MTDSDPVVRQYDWKDVSPSIAVVELVSEVTDVDPIDQPPLHETVDPDSLNQIIVDSAEKTNDPSTESDSATEHDPLTELDSATERDPSTGFDELLDAVTVAFTHLDHRVTLSGNGTVIVTSIEDDS